MKNILQHLAIVILTGCICIGLIACKKEKIIPPGSISSPESSNSQLVPVGTLSIPREYVCAATAGSKVLFAGGATQTAPSLIASSRVDIYDTTTRRWSTAELSLPRMGLVATSLGNKIYFTDGFIIGSSRVDIYDAATNIWSTAELNTSRAGLASGSTGIKAVFAGGYAANGDRIDILDASTNTWSTATLNESRADISSASLGNKIFFSGGISGNGILSNKVDIYDVVSNAWSTITMTQPRWFHASIGADNKIFWAGGHSSFDLAGDVISNNSVEIYDVNSGGRTLHQLSGCPFFASMMGNKIVFMSAFNGTLFPVDVYDIATQAWSVSNISVPSITHIGWRKSIIGVGNKIFMVETRLESSQTKVWKLEF